MISVCIATYNGAKYIYEQVSSILLQLSENDEIIISDDGSEDSTLSIIRNFRDKRIQLYINKNQGNYKNKFDYTTHNFENALYHARGDVIFLSDQDDVWLPNKVQTIVEELKTVSLVVSNCIVVDAQLEVLSQSYFAMVNARSGLINNLIHCSYLGSCMAFRKEVLEYVLPFPKEYVPHDIWIGLLVTAVDTVKFVETPTMLYRRHSGTVSSASFQSRFSLLFRLKYRIYIVFNFLFRYIKYKLNRNESFTSR